MVRDCTSQRRARIEQVLRQRQPDLTLVLANIHDPHNVSAIYRSCDAFGVPLVHLYYTDTPFPFLHKKTSASARKWVDSKRHANPDSLFAALRARNQTVLATICSPQAKSPTEYDLTLPTAIIMGNEHSGVPEELLPKVDGEIYIPMCGMIQSFNVSVAAALILSEAFRQRVQAGMYARMNWSEDEYQTLLQEWLNK